MIRLYRYTYITTKVVMYIVMHIFI